MNRIVIFIFTVLLLPIVPISAMERTPSPERKIERRKRSTSEFRTPSPDPEREISAPSIKKQRREKRGLGRVIREEWTELSFEDKSEENLQNVSQEE